MTTTVQGVGSAQQWDNAHAEALYGLLLDDDPTIKNRAMYELCSFIRIDFDDPDGSLMPFTNLAKKIRDRFPENDSLNYASIANQCILAASSPANLDTFEMLKSPDATMREGAAHALGHNDLISSLLRVELTGNPDWARRTIAAWETGLIRLEAFKTDPDSLSYLFLKEGLLQALKDENTSVRFVAAWALGTGGAEMIPELGRVLKEEDDTIVKGLLVMSLSMYGHPGFQAIYEAFKE